MGKPQCRRLATPQKQQIEPLFFLYRQKYCHVFWVLVNGMDCIGQEINKKADNRNGYWLLSFNTG